MRYRLRTLLIVLALGPLVLAGGYWRWQVWLAEPADWQLKSSSGIITVTVWDNAGRTTITKTNVGTGETTQTVSPLP